VFEVLLVVMEQITQEVVVALEVLEEMVVQV
jgi:hypothetical protein